MTNMTVAMSVAVTTKTMLDVESKVSSLIIFHSEKKNCLSVL